MAEGSADVAAYYDNLSRFLDFAQQFGRGGGSQDSSTHRFLSANAEEIHDEHHGPQRLDLLVMEAATAAGLPSRPRVLDAGCGLGGTIFRWQERLGGRYDGLTLSPEQHRRATAEAERRGIAESCSFHIRSYQDSIAPRSYDAVVAIESLAHSPDPIATVSNLAPALVPEGLMLIVDDIPDRQTGNARLAAFRKSWRCPVLADACSYRAAIAAAGLTLVHEIDLTARLRPRRLAWLKILIAAFGLAYRLLPSRAARDILDALRGGFLLEALYRENAMRYLLIVAKRPTA